MDLELNGTNGSGEDTEQLSMEQLMEMDTSVQSLKEGEVVQGTVVAIGNDGSRCRETGERQPDKCWRVGLVQCDLDDALVC